MFLHWHFKLIIPSLCPRCSRTRAALFHSVLFGHRKQKTALLLWNNNSNLIVDKWCLCLLSIRTTKTTGTESPLFISISSSLSPSVALLSPAQPFSSLDAHKAQLHNRDGLISILTSTDECTSLNYTRTVIWKKNAVKYPSQSPIIIKVVSHWFHILVVCLMKARVYVCDKGLDLVCPSVDLSWSSNAAK